MRNQTTAHCRTNFLRLRRLSHHCGFHLSLRFLGCTDFLRHRRLSLLSVLPKIRVVPRRTDFYRLDDCPIKYADEATQEFGVAQNFIDIDDCRGLMAPLVERQYWYRTDFYRSDDCREFLVVCIYSSCTACYT